MNKYRIAYDAEDGTRQDMDIIERNEAAARREFKAHYKGDTIVDVNLVAENVPATKQQERGALVHIRKMVEELGPGSYLATAFTGCFELADQNIEYDAAFSLKEEAEVARARAAVADGRAADAAAQVKPLTDKVAEMERKLTEAQLAAGALEITLEQTLARVAAAEQRAEDAELLVTQLKAKLYDYMALNS